MPISKRRLAADRRWALVGRDVFLRHGAREYREYVGEDLRPAFGGVAVPPTVAARRGETVVPAIIGDRSRADQDRGMKRALPDPRMCATDLAPMPFDPARIVYGGSTRLV